MHGTVCPSVPGSAITAAPMSIAEASYCSIAVGGSASSVAPTASKPASAASSGGTATPSAAKPSSTRTLFLYWSARRRRRPPGAGGTSGAGSLGAAPVSSPSSSPSPGSPDDPSSSAPPLPIDSPPGSSVSPRESPQASGARTASRTAARTALCVFLCARVSLIPENPWIPTFSMAATGRFLRQDDGLFRPRRSLGDLRTAPGLAELERFAVGRLEARRDAVGALGDEALRRQAGLAEAHLAVVGV